MLTACAPPGVAVPRTGGAETAAGTPAPAPSPVFVAGGTAEQNLPYFRSTLDAAYAAGGARDGKSLVDALYSAGFDKTAMQVTYDQSRTGVAADSLMVSVRIGDQCLIGQIVPSSGESVYDVEPVVDGGICLLGSTRPIDW